MCCDIVEHLAEAFCVWWPEDSDAVHRLSICILFMVLPALSLETVFIRGEKIRRMCSYSTCVDTVHKIAAAVVVLAYFCV